LRAVKGTEDLDASHDDLIRYYGKSAVTMNKVIHRVYLTWKHPRRWIEVKFPVTKLTIPQKRNPTCSQRD